MLCIVRFKPEMTYLDSIAKKSTDYSKLSLYDDNPTFSFNKKPNEKANDNILL